MRRNELAPFNEHMQTYLTNYGYGFSDTPAVFGERMMDVNAVLGAAFAPSIMWENGTQPIWKGVAASLNVQLNSEIITIERNPENVLVHLNGESAPREFDRIVMAVDPATALNILDSTPEEEDLFSHVKYMPYSTFAVRVKGIADGRSEVGYLKENATPERVGRPLAWIKRYADDDVFVVHLFAPANFSDEQIVANISEDLKKLGATSVIYVDSRRWPFFPHVDSRAMREDHFYERAYNLQGLHHTVFVNEALGMSTMASSAAQGRKAAQRMASGVY